MSKTKLLVATICVLGFSCDLFAQIKMYHPRHNNRYSYTAPVGAGGTAEKAGEILFVKLRYGKKAGSGGVIEASTTVEVNKHNYWGVTFKPPGAWLSDGPYQIEIWSKDKMVHAVEIEIVGPKDFSAKRSEESQPPEAISKVVIMGDYIIGQEKLQKGNRLTADLTETVAVAGSIVLPEGVDEKLDAVILVSFLDKRNVIFASSALRSIKDTNSRNCYICRIKTPSTPGDYTIKVQMSRRKPVEIATSTITVE